MTLAALVWVSSAMTCPVVAPLAFWIRAATTRSSSGDSVGSRQSLVERTGKSGSMSSRMITFRRACNSVAALSPGSGIKSPDEMTASLSAWSVKRPASIQTTRALLLAMTWLYRPKTSRTPQVVPALRPDHVSQLPTIAANFVRRWCGCLPYNRRSITSTFTPRLFTCAYGFQPRRAYNPPSSD